MMKMSETTKRKRFVEAGKLNQFDTKTQKLLEEIDKAQNAIEEIQQKTYEEIVALEQRNRDIRKPWQDQRALFISQIPNFWVTTLLNHPDINMLLDEEEENCLHHLKRFEVEEFPDITAGFYLKFGFEENPYFENDLLIKEYHLSGEPKCVSTTIIWKEGIQPLGQSNEVISCTPRKRRIETKSFFKWFRDNTDPMTDDIAEIFKDDIWNNPLQYYLVPDIESNDAVSSLSDSSDSEEPKRREKTDRVSKTSQGIRGKSSTGSANTSAESTGSMSGVTKLENVDMGGPCDAGVSAETNTGEETEPGSACTSTPPGSGGSMGMRRRLFMSPDYGF